MAVADKPQCQGFTLVELIAVIGLLAVLSVVAISRSVKPSDFEGAIVGGFLTAEMRFAQRLALHRQDDDVHLVVTENSGQWHTEIHVGPSVVRTANTDQGGTTMLVDGATVDAANPLDLRYDGRGWINSALAGANVLTFDDGLQVTVGAAHGRTFCVYPNGYVDNALCS